MRLIMTMVIRTILSDKNNSTCNFTTTTTTSTKNERKHDSNTFKPITVIIMIMLIMMNHDTDYGSNHTNDSN